MIPNGLVLLQQDMQFFATPDPRQTRITLIVFGVIVLVGIVAALISVRRVHHGGRRGGLSRQARRVGLDSGQRAVLKEMAKNLALQNPERLLSNAAYLNHALKRRFEQLDTSDLPDAAREQQKAILFSVKHALGTTSAGVRVLPSSRHFTVGQRVRFRTGTDAFQESAVASNVHNGVGIEIPYQGRARTASIKKGTPIDVSVLAEQDRLYTYQTKVIGFNSASGATIMYVQHASNIRQTQQRQSPRREYDRHCEYYPVTVVSTGRGRRARKQAFVNKSRRVLGRLEDLSAGGCSIRTQVPLSPGDMLKVDFESTEGTPITVFGKVRSVDRGVRGKVMHIMFTRVSRKHLNQIQSYVYGLTEG